MDEDVKGSPLAPPSDKVEVAIKLTDYMKKYSEGVSVTNDPVYTWCNLMTSVVPNDMDRRPLVKAGIVLRYVGEISPSPAVAKKEQRTRIQYKRACVITNEEISAQVKEQERVKQEKLDEKQKRQQIRQENMQEEEERLARQKEKKRQK